MILVFSLGQLYSISAQDSIKCNVLKYSHLNLYYSIENVVELKQGNSTTTESSKEPINTITDINNITTNKFEHNYLIPFMISTIKDVTSFKKILPANKNDTVYRMLNRPVYRKANNKFNKVKEDFYEEVIDTTQFPYVKLIIQIDGFSKYIEYQFRLEILKTHSSTQLLKESSFFINLDNPNYPNRIKTEIQKLFDCEGGTNKAPTAKIRIDGELVIQDSKPFFRSNLDTIYLDGLSSFDDETPKQLLKYRWSVKKDNTHDAFISEFNFENSKQKITIREEGEYTFSLQVSDGVTISDADFLAIKIHVLKKPQINLDQRFFRRISQNNLYFLTCPKREKKFFQNEDIVRFNYKEFDPSKNSNDTLVFKYLHSKDHSKKFIEKTNSFNNENELVFKFANACPVPKIHQDSNNKRTNKNEKDKLRFDTLSILLIDTCLIFDRSYSYGELRYQISHKIKPGTHNFELFSIYQGVKSNIDTLHIAFKQKSLISFYAGFDRYWIKRGDDYDNGLNLDIFKFGGRIYFTQRLSADLIIMSLINYHNVGNFSTKGVGITNLSAKISYDIFPWKSKHLYNPNYPAVFSPFISTYQLNLLEEGKDKWDGYRQLGIGAEARVQLLTNKPRLGVLYLGFDFCYYREFESNPYYTISLGLSLIYGLWNY